MASEALLFSRTQVRATVALGRPRSNPLRVESRDVEDQLRARAIGDASVDRSRCAMRAATTSRFGDVADDGAVATVRPRQDIHPIKAAQQAARRTARAAGCDRPACAFG
jgi:hypothetical protein